MKKREHANQLLEMWSKIFRSFMDPKNQKPEGMRWKDYFQKINDAEVLESPSWTLSSDLSSEDAAIKVGVFLASLKKRVASATASMNHCNFRKTRKLKKEEQIRARMEKKLKNALEKPQDQEAKRQRLKHLVSIASFSLSGRRLDGEPARASKNFCGSPLTWHPSFG